MMAYLQKYNELPKEIRGKIQTSAVTTALSEIEDRYKIDLAAVVMKVMVGDIKMDDLQNHFVFGFGLPAADAQALVNDMKTQIFNDLQDFLGFKIEAVVPASPSPTPIDSPISPVSAPINPISPRVDITPELKFTPDLAYEKKVDAIIEEKKKEMGDRRPGFFFSPDDENEVVAIARKLGDYLGTMENKTTTIEEKAKTVLQAAGIVFSSDEIEKRFINILSVYLRGVRDRIDTKEAMQKPVDYGGLGLGGDLADGMMKKIDEVNKRIGAQPTAPIISAPVLQKSVATPAVLSVPVIPPTPTPTPTPTASLPVKTTPLLSIDEASTSTKNMPALSADDVIKDAKNKFDELIGRSERDTNYDFAELASRKAPEAVAPLEKIKVIDIQPASKIEPEEVINQQPELEDFAVDIGKEKLKLNLRDVEPSMQKVPGPATSVQPVVAKPFLRTAPPSIGKSKVDDVKVTPVKILGPIDELREMDIASFRRIDKSPKIAAKKIFDKIKALEDGDYGKYIEAIKAWKQSPINVLYLTLGQEAFRDACDIDMVINRRMREGQDFMTQDELAMIIDLSRSLRY